MKRNRPHFPETGASDSRGFAEYRALDAVALAEIVRKGEADPLELLDIAVARAEAVNDKITAITVEHFELARETIKAGLPEGPRRGVPYLLKDLGVAMSGTITTEGSKFFSDQRHDYDSSIVTRYKEAGLVLFGKTHSPEFGSSPSSESALHGATRNPWDPSRSAGGSSGGSAAAVAAGVVPAAHATDGGGSIRIPASACGLVGLKPTRGRVPFGPNAYEGWGGLSCGHTVSRTVRDTAMLLDAVDGGEVGDAYATPAKERPYTEEVTRVPGTLRIALMTSPLLPIEPEADCVAAAENAAKLCASLGHEVVEAKPELDALRLWDYYGRTVCSGVALKVSMREEELGRPAGPDDLEQVNHANVAAGRAVSGVEHARARHILHAASRTLGDFQRDYDVILSPTMAIAPPKIGTLSLSQPTESFVMPAGGAAGFTALFNITGQPAISLPLHWTEGNLPIGVMFAGRQGDEATLIRLAAQIEEAQPWLDRRPTGV